MHDPTKADFTPASRFDFAAGGGAIGLVVKDVQTLPGGLRAGGGFRVEFIGPPAPILPQSIYRATQGRKQFDIFIVPLGHAPDGVRYEAIYY